LSKYRHVLPAPGLSGTQSGLEEKLTLAEFDWSFNPKVPRQACFQLHALKFIAEGKNALIIGKPGIGKSHVAKAVAYQAVQHGHKVQYLETDDFFNRYALSPPTQRETRFRAILECDLLVLDDLFLSRTIPEDASALLQALIHQRYKLHRSVVVTSNRLVQDCGAYLGDNTMSSTILDRLMHHCHLLEFDGRSYRLKEAAETLARKAKER
jgi:DNA replication protein DnaC